MNTFRTIHITATKAKNKKKIKTEEMMKDKIRGRI
jgi:hypothetical protein